MVTFSGIGAGIDLGALVDQVVAAEKIPATALAQRKTTANKQVNILGDLVTKLKALDTKMKTMDTKSELRSVTATSSNEGRVKIAASGAAQAASYKLKVVGLARAQTSRSIELDTATQQVAASGVLGIKVGADTQVNIDFDVTDTLSDIASRINASDARVHAAVLYDGNKYRMTISGEETGLANAITFTETGGSLGFLATDANVVQASDAEIELNGMSITRSTNQMTDVLDGVTFNLISKTPDGELESDITVTTDQAGVKQKIKDFVSAYNDVAKAMLTQMDDTPGATPNEQLIGDSSLQSLQRGLGAVLARDFDTGEAALSLGTLGIKLGSDGTLTLDEAKFDKAYNANPKQIEELFAGQNGPNLSGELSDLIDRYTDSVDGVLVGRQNGLRDRVKAFDTEIERINEHAEAVGNSLRAQFTALDRRMSELQSQTSYLNALFA